MKETLKFLDAINELYYNKKEIMYRLSAPLTIDTVWPIVLELRKAKGVEVPLIDQKENNFWFVITNIINERLIFIDKEAKDNFFEKIESDIQDKVILDALIDEAFNSSVIEGAFSTKKRTQEMIENSIPPTNKSEQMIINNYNALEFILENLHKPINEKIILDIYNIVVENTLDDENKVEKYRIDSVYVWDPNSQKAVYEGPHHTKVQNLMDELITFINRDDDIHPIIKSCIIHLYFVYVHPFFDGNGRTARAVSYMYLLQKGYNFFKFFSISTVVREEKSKYYKAIQNTEDYESDLTYFIYFYTEMIINSIVRIVDNFNREFKRQSIESYLKTLNIILPKRQRKIINYLIKYDKNIIDIEEYKNKYKISYETARSDLNKLLEIGLLKKSKQSKKYVYQLISSRELILARTQRLTLDFN